jgi:capsid protein
MPVIPLDVVCADFFTHLTPQKLAGKIDRGEVKLPLVRIEASQRAARGVHLGDLAAWIDGRREAAAKELASLTS